MRKKSNIKMIGGDNSRKDLTVSFDNLLLNKPSKSAVQVPPPPESQSFSMTQPVLNASLVSNSKPAIKTESEQKFRAESAKKTSQVSPGRKSVRLPSKSPQQIDESLRRLNLMYYGSKFKSKLESEIAVLTNKPPPENVQQQTQVLDEVSFVTEHSLSSQQQVGDKFYSNLFNAQSKSKRTHRMRMNDDQKLIVSDLVSIFFGMAGMVIEIISAKVYYEASVLSRTLNPDGVTVTEALNSSVYGTSFSVFQTASTFCSLICIFSIYKSYTFELNSLIRRNMIKNTCKRVVGNF